MQIKLERLPGNTFELPQYKTAGAAAFDIAACLTRPIFDTGRSEHRKGIRLGKPLERPILVLDLVLDIFPDNIVMIPTGWKIEFPANHVLIIAGRSSLGSMGLTLANNIGVIDHDYRGELFVTLHNTRNRTMQITHGQRIAQCLLMPIVQAVLFEGTVTDTVRGGGGFGSTGKV